MDYSRGSEWRKWDLHVHTPESALNNNFGGDWDKYVKALFAKAIEQNIAVIGITDYFSIDGYKKLKNDYLSHDNKLKVLFDGEIKADSTFLDKVKAIRLLPNIEFRFKDIVASGNDRKIEGHVIFSDEVSIEDIENKFLASIKFLDEMNLANTVGTPLIRANIEAFGARMKQEQSTFRGSDYVVGLNCLVIDFNELKNVLDKEQSITFADKHLILMPEDDITQINWNSGAHQVRKKYYIKSHGIFTANDNTIAWGLKDTTKDEFCSYKPCFSYSDAHSIADLFKFVSDKPCWIKADPTFAGLMQVFYQPQERVYVGMRPPKLEKVEREKYHYFERIKVGHVPEPKHPDTCWFNADIPLNSGLVAIIGNKGTGKSALADILGYMVDSGNMKAASFLNPDRFRKENKKFANDYMARLFWRDDREVLKPTLNEEISDAQTAEYLPQKHIDEICNDLNDGFQREINNMIFSYIDVAERMEMTTLDGLIEKKTEDLVVKIRSHKSKIEQQVKRIIALERKLTTKYAKEIKDALTKQNKYLESHNKAKPVEVKKPTGSNVSADILDRLNKKLVEIEDKIKARRSELLALNLKIDEVEKLISKYEFIESQVKEFVLEAKKVANGNGIEEDLEIKLLGKVKLFKDLLKKYYAKKQKLQNSLEEHSDVQTDVAHDLLLVEKRNIEGEIQKNLVAAQAEDVKYQQYVVDLKKWEESRAAIVGDSLTEGSLEYAKAEAKYLEKEIYANLELAKKELMMNIKAIYDLNFKKIDVYKSLYQPIETKLKNVLNDNSDKIEFETVLKLSKDFSVTFLSHIRQNVESIFKGRTEGAAEIDKIVRECNFNEWAGFELFVARILDAISKDKNKIDKLLTSVESCYNYIAKLEYLNVNFSLKMEGKSLEELSPGQRGNVLLIFYLALSRRSEPIIIDQPEDNLDNQSVYSKLVPCILEAKKNRQVVIVTHNPNIAVACDAEQIICSSIDMQTNAITYESGSIENANIRKKVIDILEGTMPAFELRRIKYLTR